MDKHLIEYLKKLNINFKAHEHPPVFTVEESNKLNLNIPCLHTKNLFLKDEKSNFYLFVCPGEKRADLKYLRMHLKVKKLNFASPEELKKELNLTPGSVSIFGMIYSKNVHPLVDEEVWSAKSVGFHPNLNTSTLVISHKDLEIFYDSLKCSKEIVKNA